ncbi:hypothetical protein DSECCO2_507920 [anaerobic digester metagenome]
MEDLHKDPAAAPADHQAVVEVVHRDRVVALHHQGRHVVAGLTHRFAAVLLKDLPAGELSAVDLLGERFHPGVVLVVDARTLDRILCRYIAVTLDGNERYGLYGRVLPLLLQVAESDVIKRRMGGNAHDDPGPHIRIHERRREDGDVAGERMGNRLVDERGPGDLLRHGDGVILQGEFCRRLRAYDPLLAVDHRPHVGDGRIHPEVRHAVDRLGPEGGARDAGVAPPEHHQGEPDDLGLVALEEVVVADRVLALGTVLDRVGAPDDVLVFPQVLILPLDELAVRGVDGDEPAPPVDREPRLLHHPPVLLREVADDLHRVDEPIEDVLRHPVEVAVEPDGLLVAVCNPLRDPDDRRAGDVERHREEDLPPRHPLVAGEDVRDDVGPPVPDVHRPARVRVCYGQVVLLLLSLRVGLERMLPPGDTLPLVALHIQSAHAMPPKSGSLVILFPSYRPQPDRLPFVVAFDHLLCDRAVLRKEDIPLLVHRCREEVLFPGKDIDDLALVLR